MAAITNVSTYSVLSRPARLSVHLLEHLTEAGSLRCVSLGTDRSEELALRASGGDCDALAILVTRARCKGARDAQEKLARVVRPRIQKHIRRYLTQRCRPSI